MINNMKKTLTTPITSEDLEGIIAGDIIYLNGYIVTCRDTAHRRFIDNEVPIPFDLHGLAVFHAGPIVREHNNGFEMIAIGATTSMRMEKYTYEFIKQTGVKLIVGKGSMKENAQKACKEFKALHVVYPAGCAVLAATQVEEIIRVEWLDLGMPEALYLCEVKDFGPLIVSIDTLGNNLFEINKTKWDTRKEAAIKAIIPHVNYI